MNPMLLLQQIMSGGNPMQMMLQMFGGNPAMQSALEMAQGKNEEQLKQTVQNLANQSGVDINVLTSMAKNMGIKL